MEQGTVMKILIMMWIRSYIQYESRT